MPQPAFMTTPAGISPWPTYLGHVLKADREVAVDIEALASGLDMGTHAGLPSSMTIRYTEEAHGEIEHPVGASRSGPATGCEVLRASKPQSITMGSSHGSQRNGTILSLQCGNLDRENALSGLPPGVGGSKNPVDLPLRLDDASASPTTPQGLHQ
jgi:hypothetical protein